MSHKSSLTQMIVYAQSALLRDLAVAYILCIEKLLSIQVRQARGIRGGTEDLDSKFFA